MQSTCGCLPSVQQQQQQQRTALHHALPLLRMTRHPPTCTQPRLEHRHGAKQTLCRAQPAPQQHDACNSMRHSSSGRRALLFGLAAAGALAAGSSGSRRAQAAQGSSLLGDGEQEALQRQLPGLGAPPSSSQPPQQQLPKPYTRTMRRLAAALRESIEAEAAGAKEFEVRRKADGAKDLVREFVGKWQDNAGVVGDPTHREMKEAISELGAFYQAAGPRARLSEATKTSVLRHLAAVDDALPAEEESLLGF